MIPNSYSSNGGIYKMNKRGKETPKDSSKEYKWDKVSETYIPKASPLAYTLFINERKESMKKENEKAEESKKLSIKQMARKIKSEWKNMSEVNKKQYLQIVEKEKKRFDTQRKEMEEKGYFTLTSGVKSLDITPPEKTVMKRRSTTPMKPDNKRGNNKKAR